MNWLLRLSSGSRTFKLGRHCSVTSEEGIQELQPVAGMHWITDKECPIAEGRTELHSTAIARTEDLSPAGASDVSLVQGTVQGRTVVGSYRIDQLILHEPTLLGMADFSWKDKLRLLQLPTLGMRQHSLRLSRSSWSCRLSHGNSDIFQCCPWSENRPVSCRAVNLILLRKSENL